MNRAESARGTGRRAIARADRSLMAGFSLMEVLLATSMLLASVIVLGELAGIGRRHASAARELATAQLLCENKLNEIIAGAAPLMAVDGEPLDDQPGWIYTIKIEPVSQSSGTSSPRNSSSKTRTASNSRSESGNAPSGLSVLTVTVAPEERQSLEKDHHSSKEFSLVRWVRDNGSKGSNRSVATSDVPRSSSETHAAANR